MKNEPVLLLTALPAVITAAVGFAQAMGWIHMTPNQVEAFMGFAGAVIALLAVLARSKVTPN